MQVTINDKTIPIPESWNDLTLKQQLFIYGVLMTDTRNVFDAHELLPAKRILIVQDMLGLDAAFMQKWEADCIQEDPEHGRMVFISELKEILIASTFLFELEEKKKPEDPDQYKIKLGLTKCPYTFLSFKKKNEKKKIWLAPEDGLENITIYEMGMAFTLFERFMKTKEEQYADKLLATIYRPPKQNTKENRQSAFQGDRRLPYLHHEGMVKKREIRIRLLPRPAKQLLIFWFASCRQQIIRDYPNVFTGGGEERSGNNYGWGGVLISLADGLVNLDAISRQKYSNALTYLSYLEDQRKLRLLRRG